MFLLKIPVADILPFQKLKGMPKVHSKMVENRVPEYFMKLRQIIYRWNRLDELRTITVAILNSSLTVTSYCDFFDSTTWILRRPEYIKENVKPKYANCRCVLCQIFEKNTMRVSPTGARCDKWPKKRRIWDRDFRCFSFWGENFFPGDQNRWANDMADQEIQSAAEW